MDVELVLGGAAAGVVVVEEVEGRSVLYSGVLPGDLGSVPPGEGKFNDDFRWTSWADCCNETYLRGTTRLEELVAAPLVTLPPSVEGGVEALETL